MTSNAKHGQTDTGKPFQMHFSYQLPGKPHPFCASVEKSASYSGQLQTFQVRSFAEHLIFPPGHPIWPRVEQVSSDTNKVNKDLHGRLPALR